MGMVSEFKEFAAKSSVLDLAVGVIIGVAFGRIVASLTDDLIMPVIGKIFGGLDFSSNYILLSGAVARGMPLVAARCRSMPRARRGPMCLPMAVS